MPNTCPTHGGGDVKSNPELEELMESLPENQGRSGRHKCPYCAYNAGFRKGVEELSRKINEALKEL